MADLSVTAPATCGRAKIGTILKGTEGEIFDSLGQRSRCISEAFLAREIGSRLCEESPFPHADAHTLRRFDDR